MSDRTIKASPNLSAHVRNLARDIAYTEGHASVMRAAADELDRLAAALARVTDDSAVRLAAKAWSENGPTPATFENMSPDSQDRLVKRMQIAIRAAAEGQDEQPAPELFPGTREALDRLTIRKDDR